MFLMTFMEVDICQWNGITANDGQYSGMQVDDYAGGWLSLQTGEEALKTPLQGGH